MWLLLVSLSTVWSNTLTFLFENEYNETTSMAECRNTLDEILQSTQVINFYWTYSGKILNNLGDLDSCQKVAEGQYMLIEISGEVYDESLFHKGGKSYFYQQMTSLIGLCIPPNCNL